MKASVGIAEINKTTCQLCLKINNIVNSFGLCACQGIILKPLISIIIPGRAKTVFAMSSYHILTQKMDSLLSFSCKLHLVVLCTAGIRTVLMKNGQISHYAQFGTWYSREG